MKDSTRRQLDDVIARLEVVLSPKYSNRDDALNILADFRETVRDEMQEEFDSSDEFAAKERDARGNYP